MASLAVMGSRLMGLLREQTFAFFFGASRQYDAFLTAFRIPNVLRDVVAEGALSSAFVATFTQDLHVAGKKRAFEVACGVINALVLLLTGVVGVAMVWAPHIVGLMAGGFDPEKAALTIQLTRLMLPFVVCMSVSAVAMGMLNAQGYHGIPQSASTFFNIISLATGLAAAFGLAPTYMIRLWHHAGAPHDAAGAGRAMVGMGIGTLCGGLAQCIFQIPTLRSTGFRWRPILRIRDPSFQTVMRLLGPAFLGGAAVQLNVFINSNFASFLGDKPISWLNYAFRLMQLPIGVFGVAVMTSALPVVSRHVADHDDRALGQTLARSLELVWLLTLPAALGLSLLGEPMVRLLYQHGRFGAQDTLATAAALSAYAWGLPGYAALKVIQPVYVAMGKAKTPMVISLGAVGCNAGLNGLFVKILGLGHVGLAYATSIMAMVQITVLMYILERRWHLLARQDLWRQTSKMMGASAVMGGVVWGGYRLLQGHGLNQGSMHALLELAVLLPVAMGTYGVAAKRLKIEALATLWAQLLKRSPPSAPN